MASKGAFKSVSKSTPFKKLLREMSLPLTPEVSFHRVGGSAVENVAVWALLAYAFFWLLVFDISQAAEGILLLAFLVVLFKGGFAVLKRDPLLILLFLWIAYQFSYMPWILREYPNLAEEQVKYARHYARFGLILIVAWWLGGSARNITILLTLAVIGFLIGVTFQPDGVLDSLGRIQANRRLELGYHNSEHVSVYAGFVLISLLVLRSRIIALFHGSWRLLGYGLVSFGAAYALFIVVMTQTRATWLGLLIAASIGALFSLFTYVRRKKKGLSQSGPCRHRRLWMVAALALALGVAAQLLDIPKMVENRLAAERHVVATLLQGNVDNIPLTSIGVRIVIWRQALEWIGERPLLGWGPKTRDMLFENGELPAGISGSGIHHFHNQFLELAVAYGLVGLVVFAAVGFVIGRTAWRAWRDERMPDELMLYGLTFLAFWVTVNVFESYFNYRTGAYINALVGGAFYTFRFTERKA